MKDNHEMPEMSMEDKARRTALEDLQRLARQLIHDRSSEGEEMPADLQKVTVAADDKEGLMKGLDKAEDVLKSMPEMAEHDSEDSEDLDEEEAELMKQLEEIRKKKAQKA